MSDEKKIIIDEDWKSQVEAEKETLAKEQPEQAAAAGSREMPDASFEMLLTSLAAEAMVSMGQMPNLVTQKVEINVEQAKYAIDMLQVLEDKTKGNLDPGEAEAITALLHQLRMMFVAVQQAQSTPPVIDPSGSEPGSE